MVIKISAPWLISNFWSKRHNPRNFPGSPVVKNPPGNAEDVGSIPGWGTKISYTGEQQKPTPSVAQEPQLENPCTTVKDLTWHKIKVLCATAKTWCSQVNLWKTEP